MPDENKMIRPSDKSIDQSNKEGSRIFEGKASRTGEEGIFLQPTGSHETDPFINPGTQPEGSNPTSPQASQPSSDPSSDSGSEGGLAEEG